MSELVLARNFRIGYLLFTEGCALWWSSAVGFSSFLSCLGIILIMFYHAGQTARLPCESKGSEGARRAWVPYILAFALLGIILADYFLPSVSHQVVYHALRSPWAPVVFWILGSAAFAYQWRRRVVA